MFKGLRQVLVTSFADSGSPEKISEAIPLPVPGNSIVHEISGGKAHRYSIALNEGQYLSAVVGRRSMDLNLTLYDPAGQVLIRSECHRYDLAVISLIAEGSAPYRLEVQPLVKEQSHGYYELRIEEIRPATVKDTYRIAAEKSLAEGAQLLKEWRAESSLAAVSKFKDSLRLWKAAGDRHREAQTLGRIGDIYLPLGQYQEALTYYDQALSLNRAMNDRRSEGETLNGICYAYLNRGENEKARSFCNQALKLNQATENQRAMARALNNLGEFYYGLGEEQQGRSFFEKALPV